MEHDSGSLHWKILKQKEFFTTDSILDSAECNV